MRIQFFAALLLIATAATAQLVTDINQVGVPRNSNPVGGASAESPFANVGGFHLFAATDDVHGRELWRYDIATGRASLVKDILPGSASSGPHAFHAHAGRVYFAANDGVHGTELWVSDGTLAGTAMVRDLEPGAGSSLVQGTSIVSCGSRLVFSARALGSGLELFTSDGTRAGTRLLRDIYAGVVSSSPQHFFPSADGRASYFSAFDPKHGREPWITDGTAAGTRLVSDLEPGFPSSSPRRWHAFGSRMLLSSHSGWRLWITDGTAAGTKLLSSQLHDLSNVVSAGPFAFFAGVDTNGNELWRTDGTVQGTRIFADIYPGSASSHPRAFAAESPSSFLMLTTARFRDHELRRVTPAGVQLVARMPNTQMLDQMRRAGSSFYFADRSLMSAAVWTTDGTARGTRKVATAAPWKLETISSLTGLSNGQAIVVAREASVGNEVLHTTSRGVELVANILKPKVTKSSSPSSITELGSGLIFSADDGLHGRELWVHDGSDTGKATLLIDLERGSEGSAPAELTLFAGQVFFSAATTAHGRELFATDGSARGTRLVRDVVPGLASSDVGSLRVVGDKLYFAATTPRAGRELWVSDGTASGTRLFADIVPGSPSSNPMSMTSLRGAESFVFSATTPAAGRELWSCDGLATSIRQIKDIAPGANSGIMLEQFVAFRGRVYFIASPAGYNTVWVSDGTPAGSRQQTDFFAWGRPRALTLHAGKLYVIAGWLSAIYPSIWEFDGSKMTRLQLAIGATSLTSQGSRRLLYSSRASVNPNMRALWAYDVTTRSATEIGILPADPIFGTVGNERAGGEDFFAAGQSSFFFALQDATHGRELWRYGADVMTTSYGNACSASGAAPRLRVDNAVRGQTIRARGDNARAQSPQVVLIGRQATRALPLTSSCRLYVALVVPPILDAFVPGATSWTRSYAVPRTNSLAGAKLTWQAITLAPNGLSSTAARRQLVR